MPVLLFVGMTLPALIIAVVAVLSGLSELPLDYGSYIQVTFYISAIFVAAQSPQLVSRDLRFRSVPLYFSRPITYADVLAKYAAMVAALLILLGSPILIMYIGAVLADLPFWAQTRGALKGLTGAALYATALAGIGLAIACATPAPRLRHRGDHHCHPGQLRGGVGRRGYRDRQ